MPSWFIQGFNAFPCLPHSPFHFLLLFVALPLIRGEQHVASLPRATAAKKLSQRVIISSTLKLNAKQGFETVRAHCLTSSTVHPLWLSTSTYTLSPLAGAVALIAAALAILRCLGCKREEGLLTALTILGLDMSQPEMNDEHHPRKKRTSFEIQQDYCLDPALLEYLNRLEIDVKELLYAYPTLRSFSPDRFKRWVEYFEALGVDPKRIIKKCPEILGMPRSEIQSKVDFLVDVGLDAPKLIKKNPLLLKSTLPRMQTHHDLLVEAGLQPVKVFSLRPEVFGAAPSKIRAVIQYVNQMGLDPTVVINKYPQMLGLTADCIEEKVAFIRSMHVNELRVLRKHPNILGFSTRNLLESKTFLYDAGIDASHVLYVSPQVYGLSIQSNLEPKLEFLIKDMGRSATEINTIPQYFTYSLQRRIKPRFYYLKEVGKDGFSLASMLTPSDEKFAHFAGTSLEDYKTWLNHSVAFSPSAADERSGDT